jgi:hypothetical protein
MRPSSSISSDTIGGEGQHVGQLGLGRDGFGRGVLGGQRGDDQLAGVVEADRAITGGQDLFELGERASQRRQQSLLDLRPIRPRQVVEQRRQGQVRQEGGRGQDRGTEGRAAAQILQRRSEGAAQEVTIRPIAWAGQVTARLSFCRRTESISRFA